jgi:tetratricopeptide (TPR) repeat protein
MELISPSRLALAAGTLSLVACAAHGVDVRSVHRGLDAKTLPAFNQAYEGGKAQLKSNHVGLALVLFEKALAIDPNSVAALNAVGTAYDELHFPQIAARYYARALALEPNSADTLNNMALSARIAGKPDEARLLFERAVAADAANRTIHANLDAIDAPTQVAAAAPSEEDAPADAPVVERVGENAFKLVLPPPTAVQAHVISVEPLPPLAAPVQAELSPREQAVRARIATFFTAREERRQAAATETAIAMSTTVASAGDTPTRRASAERAWFNLFRVFFEQREARRPAEDRKDASTHAARNG